MSLLPHNHNFKLITIPGLPETSAEIANLVSKAFSYKSSITQKQDPSMPLDTNNYSLFGSFLRIMGLDERKVGALAMNSVVFVAQMVSSGVYVASQYTMRKIWEWYLILRSFQDKISGIESVDYPQMQTNHNFPVSITNRAPLLNGV